MDFIGRGGEGVYSGRQSKAFQPCQKRVPEPFAGRMPLEELGIGMVHYSPLGKGYLTGKIDQNTKFDEFRFPQYAAQVHAGSAEGESGLD